MIIETISPKEIDKYIGRSNVKIIDLRESKEYRKGHIPTAINIPYKEFEYKKNILPLNYELLLYCQRGNISLYLARDLSKEGYQVKNIYGGINAYKGKLVQQ